MGRLFQDTFTQWLEAQGTKPSVYQPAGILGGPPLGWLLAVGTSTIVYRIPEETPHTLIVVMIERQVDRKGLHSPLADLVRFLALVQRSRTGIKEVQGHVSAVSWRPKDSLEDGKILAFYERYLGVRLMRLEDGSDWVSGQLENLVLPLSAYRQDIQA